MRLAGAVDGLAKAKPARGARDRFRFDIPADVDEGKTDMVVVVNGVSSEPHEVTIR